MAMFTIHIFHPAQYQTCVFDYVGSRTAHWTHHEVHGSLAEARAEAEKLRARTADGDHITDFGGEKYDILAHRNTPDER